MPQAGLGGRVTGRGAFCDLVRRQGLAGGCLVLAREAGTGNEGLDAFLAAGAVLVAVALVAAGIALRWLRIDGSDSSLPPAATIGYVAAMATIAALAATFLLLAVGLLAGEVGATSGWVWLIRTETVAIVGGLLLIGFVDSTCDRVRPLLGAGCAGLLAWAASHWLPVVQTAAEFDPVGAPVMASVLCALLLSPGPTARLVSRLRHAASQTSVHILLLDESGALLHANDKIRTALGLPVRSWNPFAKSEPIHEAFRELIDNPDSKLTRLPRSRLPG